MRVELRLSRTVEQDVILAQGAQSLFQPFDIMFQLFQGIEYPAIRSQPILLHDLFKLHKIANIEGAWIACPVIGRVEIDDRALAPYR